jgi:hypothetical protein
MILNDEATWPDQLVRYLEQNYDLFLDWECRPANSISIDARDAALKFDNAIYGLRAVLDPHVLHGYHCTRLTEHEIDHIVANGMQLPNASVLSDRVQKAQEAGLIDRHAADRLRTENLASESNRAGMIWFCFYPPHFAGQRGAERLFRSWGGEALYCMHERDPITGPVLKSLGLPCLVEADVPISSLAKHAFLEIHIYRQFLINRGLETVECIHHENRAVQPVPARNVRRIIRFPEPDFVALTQCDLWTPPLV